MKSKLAKLKKEMVPQLQGVKIGLEYRDDSLRSIRLTDKTGAFLVIERGGTYSDDVAIFVKAAPEMEDVFTVIHSIGDAEYRKDFTERHAANDFLRTLERISGIDSRMEEGRREKQDDVSPAPADDGDGIPF